MSEDRTKPPQGYLIIRKRRDWFRVVAYGDYGAQTTYEEALESAWAHRDTVTDEALQWVLDKLDEAARRSDDWAEGLARVVDIMDDIRARLAELDATTGEEHMDIPNLCREVMTDEMWLALVYLGSAHNLTIAQTRLCAYGLLKKQYDEVGDYLVTTPRGQACLDHARTTWEGLDDIDKVALRYWGCADVAMEQVRLFEAIGLVGEHGTTTPFGRACLRAGESED